MANFPVLSTGAIAQYPVSRATTFATEVIQFLDGSEQRCMMRGKLLRRWQLTLTQLSEEELLAIEEFFDANQGNFGLFTFTDPLTGAVVPNCRLQNPSIITQYLAVGNGSAVVLIEETNG
ncbi:MAG: DUF2460 domain-containing protein [Bryobacteraceae bacterium]